MNVIYMKYKLIKYLTSGENAYDSAKRQQTPVNHGLHQLHGTGQQRVSEVILTKKLLNMLHTTASSIKSQVKLPWIIWQK